MEEKAEMVQCSCERDPEQGIIVLMILVSFLSSDTSFVRRMIVKPPVSTS